MDLIAFSPDDFKSFILVLVRVSIVLFLFPLFGSGMLPNTLKAALALVTSVVLFPVVRPDPSLFPGGVLDGTVLVLGELVLGLALGLTVNLFFAGIQLAGQLVGFQTGFAVASVIDPESGGQGSVMAQMVYWVGLIIFLLIDGHHRLLSALASSFSVISVGEFSVQNGLLEKLVDLSGEMFSLAIKLGSPAIAVLLLVSAAFGIVAKVVPQINIMIVAFPLQIVVGLFFLGLSLEVLLQISREYVFRMEGILLAIMSLVRT